MAAERNRPRDKATNLHLTILNKSLLKEKQGSQLQKNNQSDNVFFQRTKHRQSTPESTQ